eukprot:1267839-Amphidinium_carterae.1
MLRLHSLLVPSAFLPSRMAAMEAEDCVTAAAEIVTPTAETAVDHDAASTKASSRGKKESGKAADSKKSHKKGTSRCPGCAKWQEKQCFPMSSKFCHSCKWLKDCLYKSCAKTNDTDCLAQQLHSDSSCKRVFDHFRQNCGKEGQLTPMLCLVLSALPCRCGRAWCVRVCVPPCMRACVHACACMRACVCVRVSVC